METLTHLYVKLMRGGQSITGIMERGTLIDPRDTELVPEHTTIAAPPQM